MLFTVQHTQCHVDSTVCRQHPVIHDARHLPCWLLSQRKTGAVGVQELVSLAPPAFGLSAVWLVMATTATLKLTRSTYKTNEPKNVITARMYVVCLLVDYLARPRPVALGQLGGTQCSGIERIVNQQRWCLCSEFTVTMSSLSNSRETCKQSLLVTSEREGVPQRDEEGNACSGLEV